MAVVVDRSSRSVQLWNTFFFLVFVTSLAETCFHALGSGRGGLAPGQLLQVVGQSRLLHRARLSSLGACGLSLPRCRGHGREGRGSRTCAGLSRLPGGCGLRTLTLAVGL